MKDFFQEFKFLLEDAIRSDYRKLLDICNHEKPYVCALVTDSDAMTLYFAMNTEEKLKVTLSNEGNEYKSYYKWTPSEWAYGDHLISNGKVAHVSDLLAEESELEESKKNFAVFEQNLYECMTDVLNKLVKSEYFVGMTVFISVSDDERARKIEDYSASLLNSKDIVDVFTQRYD